MDARAVMPADPTEVAALTGHADCTAAVSTPDHSIPLRHLAGLTGDASAPPMCSSTATPPGGMAAVGGDRWAAVRVWPASYRLRPP